MEERNHFLYPSTLTIKINHEEKTFDVVSVEQYSLSLSMPLLHSWHEERMYRK